MYTFTDRFLQDHITLSIKASYHLSIHQAFVHSLSDTRSRISPYSHWHSLLCSTHVQFLCNFPFHHQCIMRGRGGQYYYLYAKVYSLIFDLKIDSVGAAFKSVGSCVQYLVPRFPMSPSVKCSLFRSVTRGTV